jgi:hypothetical protein
MFKLAEARFDAIALRRVMAKVPRASIYPNDSIRVKAALRPRKASA